MEFSKKFVAGLVGCGLFAAAGSAQAANICVDNVSFPAVGPFAAIQCAETCDGSNDCDIRDALAKADQDNTPDTIIFDPLVFPAGSQTPIGTTSTIAITSPVTIQGPGPDSLVIDNGGHADNVFEIAATVGPHTISGMKITGGARGIRANEYVADVILSNLVIEGNSANTSGGGVLIDNDNGSTGTVRIQNCVITNNNAQDAGGGIESEDESVTEITDSYIIGNLSSGGDGFGGGVAVVGDNTITTITDSIISQNDAEYYGGGLYVDAGSALNVADCLISENTATNQDGGGIMLFNDNAALLTQADITGTSITGNIANDDGGAIATDGAATFVRTQVLLTITNSTIRDNEALNDDGGGINNREATATISKTTITGNISDNDGGGINNEARAGLTINDSTLFQNTAGADGGGLNNQDGLSTVEITNSTISRNFAETDGGGIQNENDSSNTVTLLNVTITGNMADADFGGSGGGGGIEQRSGAGTFTITNSIIAGNVDSDGAPDCETSGTAVASGGNNLIGTDQGCSDNNFDLATKNDKVGILGSEIDPLLGPLFPANGGDPASGLATGIHEPLTGSPAIDGVDGTPPAPATDQHNVPRPIGAAADIGAVEVGCGDGEVNLGEACDDGGESAICNVNCTTSACGDTVVNATAGETCDDGNTTAGDGCSDTCMTEACGNGVLDSGEQCEDGNTDSNDGCSSTCQSEFGAGTDTDGDGIPDATDVDDDGDGVLDTADNCPLDVNANQADVNSNGIGDLCEPDSGGGGCSLVR